MGGGDFRRLRQHNRDAVARLDAVFAQDIREPVRSLAQPAKGNAVFAPVRMHVQDGEAAGLGVGPFVATVDANVIARRNFPAELAREGVEVFGVRQHWAAR